MDVRDPIPFVDPYPFTAATREKDFGALALYYWPNGGFC